MYVGTGKPGARGLARKNGVSRSLRGFGLSRTRANRMLGRRLGQIDYGSYLGPGDFSSTPISVAPAPSGGYNDLFGNTFATNPTALGPSASGGGLTPSEVALATAALNQAGAITKQAITPVPSVLYNPATGLYSATGGAALPAGLGSFSGLTSSLSSLLPLLLLGGGLLVVVSLVKK